MNQANIIEIENKLKQHEQASSGLYAKVCRMRKHTKLAVTDHAIVRYQQRIKLLPVGEILDKLTNNTVKNYYEKLGDGIYPIGEGTTRVVIQQGVIVSVYI